MLFRQSSFVCCFLFAVSLGLRTAWAEKVDDVVVERDIVYATIATTELKLDLYRPAKLAEKTLIVWIHGGAWRAGSKRDMPLLALVRDGYAIASVDYRLSPQAHFPAQVHDIKAALRFLRGKQSQLQISAEQIVVAGSSAGGHLAALVGTSNDHAELEGKVGEQLAISSRVQGVVSFYGMSNLTTILAQSTPHGLKVRVPALQLLLGGQPEEHADLARLASPVFHVSQDDPPLLLLHGDQDPQAPINQSHELQGKYKEFDLPCELIVMHGSAHGGAAFYLEEQLQTVKKFIRDLPNRSGSTTK